MKDNFDIQEYLAKGAENIIKNAISATFKNPKEIIFLTKFIKNSRKAAKIRKKYSINGLNIPAFLIASITDNCNLHCTGCYSIANNSCKNNDDYNQLSDDDWEEIFNESKKLGINFIVLAGGEPLLREDVILKACKFPEILFPVFTNGTMLNENYYDLVDKYRNIVPILSIEGDEKITDLRRGKGIYNQLVDSMNYMKCNNLIFGSSITITNDNLQYAVSDEFILKLRDFGCKVLFFIEYVPIDRNSDNLALTNNQRDNLLDKITELRTKYPEMLFMSFPGDEKSSGGCLAAGRGFFHINANGSAEPCPASPYSDINVKETSIIDALNSNLFKSLREDIIENTHHDGSCILFEHEEEVQKLVNNK